MFAWLNDLTFRTKIVLVLAFPLAGLLFAGATVLLDRGAEVAMAARAESAITLTLALDGAVHELQKERGLSAGFVGAGGKEMGDALRSQRRQADAALGKLQGAIGQSEQAGVAAEVVASARTFAQACDDRGRVRDAVDGLKPIDFFAYYSEANALGLGAIRQAALTMGDVDLIRGASALAALLWAKERAGQNRAVMSRMFARGTYDATEGTLLARLTNLQTAQLDAFRLAATPAQIERLQAASSDPSFAAVEAMRATMLAKAAKVEALAEIEDELGYGGLIHRFKNYLLRRAPEERAAFEDRYAALEKSLADFRQLPNVTEAELQQLAVIADTFAAYADHLDEIGRHADVAAADQAVAVDDAPALAAIHTLMTGVGDVSADAWFAQATRRINLVKEVADATAGDIVQRAERVAQAASRTFTLFSLLIAGLVVIAAALGALVVRRMIPLRAVTERLRALALGDSSFDRIEAQGRDEVGELQTAYNAFVVGLAKLVSRGETLAQGAVDTTPITDGMAAGLGFSEAAAAAARRATSTPEGADLSVQGPLATAFQTLETSQAQLALQAQTIARDDLTHPLLTVRLEGVLGKAFGDMTERLQLVAEQSAAIANGDLAHPVLARTSEGTLGTAVTRMISTLREIMTQLQQTSALLSSTSSELLASAQGQQSGATEQAASVEETKRTLEALLNASLEIAEVSQLVFDNAELTQRNAKVIASRIGELSTHTDRIGEILTQIKDIANKSDLLALNAALEGTKAGEAGRGFSLVATQMQRLAEQVMGAAKNIETLTADISQATNSSVLATEEATKLAAETTDSARKISLGAQQQQGGTQQATTAVDEIAEVTRDAVGAATQLVAAADQLSSLSGELQAVTDRFRLNGNGAR